jgi:hypothetical protein
MRKIYITEKQLNEIIDSDLMFSTSTIPQYQGSTVATTEPVDDEEEYGDPMTSDDKAENLPPGLFQRLTSKGVYGGPMV